MKKSKSFRTIAANATHSHNKHDDPQFELELCWCIQQLETALNSGKLSRKVAEDTVKNLKVLKGTSAPLIKKRQVMKAATGDYRAKMKEEENEMDLASIQINFTPGAEKVNKSSFIKKSAILNSGKDFKFCFDTTVSGSNGTKEVQLTKCKDFTFNFSLNEENNEIKFDELSII